MQSFFFYELHSNNAKNSLNLIRIIYYSLLSENLLRVKINKWYAHRISNEQKLQTVNGAVAYGKMVR